MRRTFNNLARQAAGDIVARSMTGGDRVDPSTSEVRNYVSYCCVEVLVGATGFEPATSSSQNWRSTKLSYAPVMSAP